MKQRVHSYILSYFSLARDAQLSRDITPQASKKVTLLRGIKSLNIMMQK